MSRAYLYAVMLAAILLAVPLASGAATDLPPTPTIDSAPPNPSATSTATLSFSDADPLVTFRCQIDGGAFSLCTSPASYSGLGDGSHTFGVKAVDVLLNESDVVSYTWSVDTTPPPAPTITAQPSNPSNDSSPAFEFTDTEGGISFRCKLDSGGFATCASPVTYSGQADDSHTFTVQATDAAGNTSSTSYSWTIDTVAPAVTLGTKPLNPSNDPTPSFSFSAGETSTFQCQLDAGALLAARAPPPWDQLPTEATPTRSRRRTQPATRGRRLSLDDRHSRSHGDADRQACQPVERPHAELQLLGRRDQHLPVPARRRRLRSLHEPHHLGLNCRRKPHLHGQGDGHGRQYRAGDLVCLDDRHGRADGHPEHQAPESDERHDTGLRLQRERDGPRRVPVSARRSRLRRLHQPESAHYDGRRVAYLHRQGNRRGRKHRADELHLDDRYGGAADHPGHQAHESHKRHDSGLRLQRERDAPGGLPVPARRCRLRSVHEPEALPATADGSHTFTVKAIDTAGNPGQTSYTWTIDTDPSTITLTQTPSNFSSDSTPTFAFTADEPIPGGFQCRLDAGGTFAPCSSPTTLSATADGPHTFTVRGSDAAGNLGQTATRGRSTRSRRLSRSRRSHRIRAGSPLRTSSSALLTKRVSPISVSSMRGRSRAAHRRKTSQGLRTGRTASPRKEPMQPGTRAARATRGRSTRPSCRDHHPGAAEPHQPNRRDVRLHLEQEEACRARSSVGSTEADSASARAPRPTGRFLRAPIRSRRERPTRWVIRAPPLPTRGQST